MDPAGAPRRRARAPARRTGSLSACSAATPCCRSRSIDADTLQTRLLGAFAPSPLFAGQYLPFFDQYARSHRLWSPDSDALVMPAVGEDGVVQVVVFGVDGDVTPLGPGDLPAWNVR